MTIHIVDEKPDIYLTRDQYDRLLAEYNQAFMFYSGTPPSFESWVRSKQQQRIVSNGTGQRTIPK